MEKNQIRRLNLKNGWDLPEDEKVPLTGRKQELVRAYELLIMKSDEEYIREAEKRANLSEKQMTAHAGSSSKSESTTEQVLTESAAAKEWETELWGAADEGRHSRRKKHIQIGAAVVAAVIIIIAGRFLFGPPVLLADISAYADVPITVEGLTEEPFDITPEELADMKLTSVKVDVHETEVAPDEEPELGRAIGPSLETFLAEYDMSLDDIRSMKVYTEREKSTAYVHTLEDSDIVLSVANGRKPLGEKEAPLRIAIRDTDAGEWSGWIRRIVFTVKE